MITISNSISGTNVSTFGYTYNPVGTIATWSQQADSNPTATNTLTYDPADQLISSTNTLSGTNVASNAYNYDPTGNRLAETTISGTTAGQFNNVNQLTGYSSSTTNQTIAGNTSAAVSSVTVNALAASISSNTNFSVTVPLPPGTNVVSIVAQPTSSNTPATTQREQIVTTGTAPTALTYDANGNTLTDENGNTYTWDALNRLISITYPSGASSWFAYDGLSRRVQIVEKNSSNYVVSMKNYLWVGSEMAEERDSSNYVTKRFFPQGEQQSGTAYYYTRDHLGSVREMCNSSGTIISRLDYDPWGRVTVIYGTTLPDMQYAGYYTHQTSGLNLTKYRAYDPNTARWLSRDPLPDVEQTQGPNLYEYVHNQPTIKIDRFGLDGSDPRDYVPGDEDENLDSLNRAKDVFNRRQRQLERTFDDASPGEAEKPVIEDTTKSECKLKNKLNDLTKTAPGEAAPEATAAGDTAVTVEETTTGDTLLDLLIDLAFAGL